MMKIDIGQTTWEVIETDYIEDFGEIDPIWAVIKINIAQQRDQFRDTLLHEILHAIVCTYGINMGSSENEEAILKSLTPALLDVLCSNPLLLNVLCYKDKNV